MDTNLFSQYNVDVVIDSIGVITNKQQLDSFFNDLILNKASSIRILVFGIEGQTIIKTIEFDGSEIRFTNDAMMTVDKYLLRYSGNRLKKEKNGNRIEYNLYQDDEFIVTIISVNNSKC